VATQWRISGKSEAGISLDVAIQRHVSVNSEACCHLEMIIKRKRKKKGKRKWGNEGTENVKH
jgi:hypothetical protein